MLNLYHDLGTILYFGGDGNREEENSLKDIVILDPQWLIEVFKCIVTVKPKVNQQVSITSMCFMGHMEWDILFFYLFLEQYSLVLSQLDFVQKETMWSLILYVICMYVVLVCGMFCKIDHCIHIHWCIPMELGHNDPWIESHM